MFKKLFKIVLIPLILAVVFLPHQASAVSWFPLVPCGLNSQPAGIPKTDHDYTQDCNQCLLVELGKNVIDMTSFAIVPAIGTLLFLWAGFRILFGAREGNPAVVKEGTKIMTATAIGIAIILGAWLITNFILRSIATEQVASTPWYQIQCRVGTLKDIVDGTQPSVPTNGGGGGTSPGGTGTGSPGSDGSPTGPGATCTYSGTNLCEGKAMTCSNSMCSKYVPSINTYAAKWSVDAKLIKAVIMKESSCDATKSNLGGNSYGLMAFQPGTAVLVSQYCGVSKTNASDPAWLTNPANSDAVICMGAYYLHSIGPAGQCGTNIENIAAGYNAGPGYCAPSADCTSDTSCTDGGPMRKWECLYDDTAHKVCNTKLNETKDYAPKIQYCYSNPGF